jgi:hypothetical protein
MILLTLCITLWVIQFCVLGLQPSLLPTAGAATGGAYSSLISTVVFNFGFVATVPSWLNEKGPAVRTSGTLWASVGFATFLYLVLGFFGGLALDFRSPLIGVRHCFNALLMLHFFFLFLPLQRRSGYFERHCLHTSFIRPWAARNSLSGRLLRLPYRKPCNIDTRVCHHRPL